jgi:erythromycin esterase-like protein
MNNSEQNAYSHLINIITKEAEPLLENNHKYDALMEKIGDARFVLMGEATHGTEEFYQARIEISQRLIKEKGFMAIAIEGDWPNVYSIHQYVQGAGDANDVESALSSFKRFPTWMWHNKTISPFLQWLRNYNDDRTAIEKIDFFGLDLYSFYDSMQAVIDYLEKVDPTEAQHAKQRYACFDHVNNDPQEYAYLVQEGLRKACTKQVIEQLIELRHNAAEYIKKDGINAVNEYFYALQNARLVKNAENYYRSMFDDHNSSWNNRDTHMAQTLESIADFVEYRLKKPAKIIVWAHNSHVGDARATQMGESGELNIGQLVREIHPADTYLIGFSTYQGTVTAASSWGDIGQIKNIVPGLDGSYEELFHVIPYDNFLLELRGNKTLEHYLQIPRLQRAIGVVYLPETERLSHYYFTRLPYQFDCMIHFDKTTAITE